MLRLLPFVALPVLELWILLELGVALGPWPVIAWCAAMVVVGLALIRRESRLVAELVRTSVERGVRARLDVDRSALIGMAGMALVVPGVLTDALALYLLGLALWRSRGAARPAAGPRPDDAPRPGPRPGRGGIADVEIIPPGRIPSPFRKRPRVIDVD